MCNNIDECYNKLLDIEVWILVIGVVKNIDTCQFWIFETVSVLFLRIDWYTAN